jgi:hypothetical protein
MLFITKISFSQDSAILQPKTDRVKITDSDGSVISIVPFVEFFQILHMRGEYDMMTDLTALKSIQKYGKSTIQNIYSNKENYKKANPYYQTYSPINSNFSTNPYVLTYRITQPVQNKSETIELRLSFEDGKLKIVLPDDFLKSNNIYF